MRRALALMLLAVALVGCSSSGGRALTGIRRTPPLEVGSVSVPEVAPGSGSFAMKASAAGRLLVTYFGYTNCPDLCPTTFAALRTALKNLGADASKVDLVFVTVDPARDTASVLSAYLGSFFADRWHAARLEDPTALSAAEQPFLASSSVTTTFDGRIAVTHTATTYVIDHTGKVLVEWGYPTTAADMTADLSQLIKEQS